MFGKATDDEWKLFPARLIQHTGACVLPVCFEGQNGPIFHLASKVSEALRDALLLREVTRRIGGEVVAHVGAALYRDFVARHTSRQALLAALRERVYELPRIEPRDTASATAAAWRGSRSRESPDP